MNGASFPICAFTPRTKIGLGLPDWLTTVFTIGQGSTLAPAIAEPTFVFIFTTLGGLLTAIPGASSTAALIRGCEPQWPAPCAAPQ